MTKIIDFFPTLKMLVFNLFSCAVQGTLNVTLVNICIIFSREVCV